MAALRVLSSLALKGVLENLRSPFQDSVGPLELRFDATQAILPSLTAAYGVSPAAMGLAVNSSTFGMAAAGLAVAFFGQRIERRLGVLLSVPHCGREVVH